MENQQVIHLQVMPFSRSVTLQSSILSHCILHVACLYANSIIHDSTRTSMNKEVNRTKSWRT
jgi:hypothetical protein